MVTFDQLHRLFASSQKQHDANVGPKSFSSPRNDFCARDTRKVESSIRFIYETVSSYIKPTFCDYLTSHYTFMSALLCFRIYFTPWQIFFLISSWLPATSYNSDNKLMSSTFNDSTDEEFPVFFCSFFLISVSCFSLTIITMLAMQALLIFQNWYGFRRQREATNLLVNFSLSLHIPVPRSTMSQQNFCTAKTLLPHLQKVSLSK